MSDALPTLGYVQTPRRGGGVRRAVIAGVVLIVIVATVWAFSGGRGAADEDGLGHDGWYAARLNTFDITVRASGELEAKRKVELKNEVEGATTITEIIDEGVTVAEGDVLVRLAADDLTERIEQERLTVEETRADTEAKRQALAIQESEASSQIKAAQVKVTSAELERDRWLYGTDPTKLREYELAVETAQRASDRAKRDLELSKQLFEEQFISFNDLEDSELQVINTANALQTAQINLEVYKKYERVKEQQKIESDLEQAQEELARTRQKMDSELTRVQVEYTSAAKRLEIREQRLAKLDEQLAKTVVRAPQAGMVVYASSVGPQWRRGDPMAQGRQVRFNETLIILPDTRQMVAVLKVHEAMVSSIEPGDVGVVTIDALPDLKLQGTVSQIGVMAEDGGWFNPDLREYAVRLELPEEEQPTLKPAMRCEGTIVAGTLEDALSVPVQAVFSEGDERFCYVAADGGKVARRPVTVGPANDTLVQIIEGLEKGDRVLMRKPKPGELAEAAKPATPATP